MTRSEVRPLRAGDVDLLEAVFRDTTGRRYGGYLDSANDASSLFVAWVDDAPVGRVAVAWDGPRRRVVRERYPDCPEIHTLAVLDAFQRRGIGASLVRRCEAEALRRGHRHVGLGTDPSVPDARSLYVRLGYRPSEVDRYDDVYTVVRSDGASRTFSDPARWLIKPLPNALPTP